MMDEVIFEVQQPDEIIFNITPYNDVNEIVFDINNVTNDGEITFNIETFNTSTEIVFDIIQNITEEVVIESIINFEVGGEYTGLKGDIGLSAYEVYISTTTDNPIKTINQWLLSLKSDAGIANDSFFEAGEIFGGGRLLILSNGKAYKFNASSGDEYEREIGFSTSAAIEGDIVAVRNFGKIEIGSLIQDAIYYANDDGLISTNPISEGTMLKVGIAIDNQFLEIKFSQSIII